MKHPSLSDGTGAEQPSGTARLRDNVFALSIVQLSGYIVPLVTLPYLTRVLGPEAYGKVIYAQVLMTYCTMIVDYGFSWSATRKIAVGRADRKLVSSAFLGTWLAQWLLVILSGLCTAAVVLLSHRLYINASLYAAAFTLVIGDALFPIWLLQGLEHLKLVALLQLTVRALTLIPIFTLVTRPSDAIIVLLINGGSTILIGIVSLVWISRKCFIDWRRPSFHEALRELRDGFPLFTSRLSVSFYTIFVPLALGWFAGPIVLATFQVADKLRSTAQSMLSPLSQALYPHVSLLFATNRDAALSVVNRSVLLIAILASLGGILLFTFSNPIITLIAGHQFARSASVLRYLAFVPLIVGLSNMFGVQIMLPNGMNWLFNTILIAGGILGILVIIPFVITLQATGAALSVLLIELFITISMGVAIYRRGYLFARRATNNEL